MGQGRSGGRLQSDTEAEQKMRASVRRIDREIERMAVLETEQVKATRPTFDYDGRWGQTTGRWTTEQFIEAVYRGVKAPAKQED